MAFSNPNSATRISFTKDASLVADLVNDLKHEQEALIVADLDLIERIVEKRAVLMQALSSAANDRYKSLAAAGFEANESGMVKWMKLQADHSIDQAWADFQYQLTQAKELNRINGLLIHKHFQRNQEKLNALNGSTMAPQMYGRNGHSNAVKSSRAGFSV